MKRGPKIHPVEIPVVPVEIPEPVPVDIPIVQPQEAPGLECKRCGCRHFWTTNTLPLKNGRIRRYRECRNCGRNISTIEVAECQ